MANKTACKTASGNTLKARQNAQERSGRTQKGGQGQSLDEFRMSC